MPTPRRIKKKVHGRKTVKNGRPKTPRRETPRRNKSQRRISLSGPPKTPPRSKKRKVKVKAVVEKEEINPCGDDVLDSNVVNIHKESGCDGKDGMISRDTIKSGDGICVDKACYDKNYLEKWLNTKSTIPHNPRKQLTLSKFYESLGEITPISVKSSRRSTISRSSSNRSDISPNLEIVNEWDIIRSLLLYYNINKQIYYFILDMDRLGYTPNII